LADLKVLDSSGALNFLDAMVDSGDSNAPLIMVHTSEHKKSTFRYAGTFTPVATPTDVMLIQGSATMTLRVKRMVFSGLATTAGNMPITLFRRSTAPTLGSAALTAITAGKHDTNDAAPTGVVSTVGTANVGTVGTTAGHLGQGRIYLPLVTTVPSPITWEFATRNDKPFILRGTTDYIAVNLNGAALPAGGVIDYEFEIEEDGS
jgi:hypothetical protein